MSVPKTIQVYETKQTFSSLALRSRKAANSSLTDVEKWISLGYV